MGKQRDTLEIRMLGELSVSYGKADISEAVNRSKRFRTMLAYMLTNRERSISLAELTEVMWQEDETDNPSNTLKTILHRLRSALSQLGLRNAAGCISYKRGVYQWTPTVRVTIDTEDFDRFCAAAEAAGEGAERARLYADAVKLYRGHFLPKNSHDAWVVPLDAYYHSMFIKAVTGCAEYLISSGSASEAAAICRDSIQIDQYEEKLHALLIRALIASGNQQQALEHYDYVTKMFFNKFGVNPSNELTELYSEVMKSSKTTEASLGAIIEELREDKADTGCFYCEFEPFRTIYRLEARAAARSGQVVYICLLTVSPMKGKKLRHDVLLRAMDKVRETVLKTLRHGDLFTRYSANQFLIMLPATSYEAGRMVMRRVTTTFRRAYPRGSVALSHTLQPIVPAALDRRAEEIRVEEASVD
ncbi:MAG: hypothetical protein LBH17_04140 [Oscillospiraceae bacterium]|jgi:DNA-binding SARP family transcriptional activator|nr:hypothetical protein [Oscillospiraceae bacterium]